MNQWQKLQSLNDFITLKHKKAISVFVRLLLSGLICICLGLSEVQVYADTPPQQAQGKILYPLISPKQDVYVIGPSIEILADESNSLTFEEISSSAYQDRFFTTKESIKNFGFSHTIYWLKIRFDPKSTASGIWILELDQSAFNYVDAYIPGASGFRSVQTGNWRPFVSRDYASNNFAFKIDLSQTIGKEPIYLRLEHSGGMTADLKLWDFEAYTEKEVTEHTMTGLYYGAMLVMFGYNFIMGLYLRSRNYFYYAIFVASLICISSLIDGHAQQFLLKNLVQTKSASLFIASMFVSGLLLTSSLLEFKKRSPQLYKSSNSLITILILQAIVALFFDSQVFRYFQIGLILFCISFMFGAGLHRWIQGYTPAKIYTWSWAWFFVVVILYILSMAPGLPFDISAITQVCTIFQMIFMSLALGEQFRQIKIEKALVDKALFGSQQEAYENLKESENLKDSFLSTITHELLTPINGMRLSFSLMEKEIPESIKMYFDTASVSNLHLLSLVETMIAFAEARRGNLVFQNQTVNLNKTLEFVFSQFANIERKNIKLKLKIDEQLPEWIIFDQKKLILILTHLMKNAYSFTREGKITLSAMRTDETSMTLSVEDTGRGISQDVQKKILESFSQVDESASRKVGGLGIGLTLIKDLLEAIKGKLVVESELGLGSTVSALMPIRAANDEDIAKAKLLTIGQEQTDTTNTQTIEQSKILVVEDNAVSMKLMLRLVEKIGYIALPAYNGEEAIKQLKQNEDVAVVLMDCQMPVMDGFKATQQIRKMKGFEKLPIVALTANTSANDRERCHEVGMDDFLSKPVNKEMIRSILLKWLDARER